MTSLFYVSVILPFGLFYTETNEGNDFKWRFCLAMRKTVVLLVIMSLILFPSYAYLRYAYIPVTARTCVFVLDESSVTSMFLAPETPVTSADTKCVEYVTTLEMMVGFPVYAIGLMTIIGYVMLIFFLPTGVWGIPFRLFGIWAMRPRSMS